MMISVSCVEVLKVQPAVLGGFGAVSKFNLFLQSPCGLQEMNVHVCRPWNPQP